MEEEAIDHWPQLIFIPGIVRTADVAGQVKLRHGRGDDWPHLHAAVLEVALPFGLHLLLVLDERRQAQRLPLGAEVLQLHQCLGRATSLPTRRNWGTKRRGAGSVACYVTGHSQLGKSDK